ncbi:MAG: ribosome small subunit-dependent GTPase A [Candidatus Delongbacteria bacterium]|nr:ribosome small subunit-dependent GTPase A [Candidatus Delongbacteria bacterium]
MATLTNYGWSQFFENNFTEYKELNYQPARVTKESINQYWLMTENGEEKAKLSTKFFMDTFGKEQLPVVGDWVAVQKPEGSEKFYIEAVLPRKTRLIRKGKDTFGRNFVKAGDGGIRVISSNIDTVFYVASLDHRDFNITKIERYLVMLYESGAQPVLILNKKDICPEYEEHIKKVKNIAGDLPVFAVSAIDLDGFDELFDYLKEGQTVSFIGSSGVGKSSIVNVLMGEDVMYVSNIREGDKRGKHTTTHREMIIFPEGGILIDNPGIRDLKPVASQEALENTFEDIYELESMCKFSNCTHNNEPGCAINEALETDELSEKRYENYLTLKREARFFEKRANQREEILKKAAEKEKRGGKKTKKHMRGKKNRDKYVYEY